MCVWGEGWGGVPMLLVLVDTMPTQDISSPLAAVRSVHGRELLTSVMRGFMDAKSRHFKNHLH